MFILFFTLVSAVNDWKRGRTPNKSGQFYSYKKDITDGCKVNMRKFGPSNIYECNCRHLESCDFSNMGKCKIKKCLSGYGGAFCQLMYLHEHLKQNISETKNVFTNVTKEINNFLNITFKKEHRIHLLKFNCQSSVSETNITLKIGSTKFYEGKCTNVTQSGDASGKYLLIKTSQTISFSKLRVFGCSPFWFGQKCDKQCHCANYTQCHKISGNCPMGCESGRSGPDCQKLNYENVALKKKASQSSTYNHSTILFNNTCQEQDFNFSADLAVDGNTDQQHERCSCMHTNKKYKPSWQVDLGKRYNISQIRIYPRNANLFRIENTEIHIDDSLCATITKPKEIIDIQCTNILEGSIVKISRNDNKRNLNFCEVEVLQCLPGFYGYRCKNSCPECKNSSCEQWSGTCQLGCSLGYKFNKTCTACEIGTFGEECSQTCHCKNNINCNKTNGNCIPEGCEAGYKGSNCQEPCSTGTFGEGCLQTCHCKNNNNCNHKNGSCGSEGCEAGYKGPTCQESKFNIYIPIIIGLVIIGIVIVGLIIYFKVKRSKRKKKDTSLIMPKVSLQENIEMNSVDDNINDDDNQKNTEPVNNEENIYMNTEYMQNKTIEITKDNIFSYVKKKKKEDLPFAEEFLKLPKGLLYKHNAANADKNRGKNRYKTILPYDHSRVCLLPDEFSSSDYINANYLTENKTYIATQGPLSSTITDFWKMIHQTKCSIIVMLTKLSENGKLKSEQYWPELEVTKTYGNISVSNKRENKYSYYTYRQFCITKNSENFLVDHYQFTSWPDHGAPKDPGHFIAFRNQIHSSSCYKPPILVHCSAGVGRSGSYIVLDIILEEMKYNSKIDVIGCILKLRNDRTLMVQNRSQLEYIYDVLIESIITGPTMIYIHKLPQVYDQLLNFQDENSTTLMKLQFEKLVLPLNTTINDCPNNNDTSVCYDNEQNISDDENNDVLDDMTILSGNNLEEEFILLNTPSEEKLADFWSAIFLKRCTILVMFNNLPSEEAIYWPKDTNVVAEYKHFAVKLVEEDDNKSYIKRTMKVSSSVLNMPELLVHQLQFKSWLGNNFPSPKEMVEIIQTVQSLQISKSHKQIILHCLYGINKKGLFCVLYMIIEILKRESLISIEQLIRQVKKKKKEIISDYLSYQYCWLVAKIFLEDYTDLSNQS
ncbi:Receptor-type tyrosine-protein phosphatase O,Tyrosine-protein phosphatase non-receptor type 11,Tyrosine-protein phosphatase corkscrew,Receptor-type tyrosine-protein phosphatase eta [Acanthosepion pharaonis]|uniref:protein-tyrosine-phosphatase n=1 Tax=Acanthosepion pharaonis TaxID=158019 RepID=A0A812CKP9_ACAPH|nr:Receptor-type tyrosine-protein phosphatase O,Tyrosine-protein phosphatase non-receptor type 11,Tyrosine-protein phosphatase corkscrew,Receptor-type tyrosine-protein phosphatase eta [Sepia pharaonis]